MEDRDKVLKSIIEFAQENENIRALVLQGSLINLKGKLDYFSDIDPLFYVSDPEELANNTEWILKFGNIMTNLFDESKDENNSMHYMRMVIYENGLKVDFGIASVKVAKYANKMPLYKIILDKDGILPFPSTTDDSNFYVKKPSREEYLSQLNDFFWDTTYIAKSLYREEIYFAHFMESNIHLLMRPIIEWFIGINYNFKVNTGLEGRNFKELLKAKDWELVLKSFSDANTDNIFKALYASFDLVKHMGESIGDKLNYPYPINHEQKVLKYIKKTEQLTIDK